MDKIKERVILVMMPFWPPLIPPQGISRIKSYLKMHGYSVTNYDLNTDIRFKQVNEEYFSLLNHVVSSEKQGNIFDLGYVVLKNQTMAHTKCKSDEDYIILMKDLFKRNFMSDIKEEVVFQFRDIVAKFYVYLDEYLSELIEAERPDVIGLSVYSDNISASIYALKKIRQMKPNIKLFIGGGIFAGELLETSPNFSDFLEETKDCLDKVFIGQGEKLVHAYLNGELDENHKVYHASDMGNTIDISQIVAPDMSDFDIKQYPYIATYASKGCPNKCSFCTVRRNFGDYQERDLDNTIEEIQQLKDTYKKRMFFMIDSLMNPYISGLSNKIIENDLDVYIDGYLRVSNEACDINNALLWRKAGIYRVRLGVESGSQHVLDLMNKGITVDQIRKTLASLAYAGIKTTTYWVIGHPGETEENFLQTLKLLEDAKDDIWQAECHIFEYFYDGQPSGNQWEEQREFLYQEKVNDLLVCKSWNLKTTPTREEALRRVGVFAEKCKELGIPNPNRLNEINFADNRWKELHSNAVPNLLNIQDEEFKEDKTKIEMVNFAESKVEDAGFKF